MIAGYTIEAGTRTAFVQRRLIETQREELADRNVEMDSALRASLDEVRGQAEELRASRARIVVAADVERRRIEAAVYFSVLEALQNVAKYARATKAVVVLSDEEGTLTFEVCDDGMGFDPETATHGIGLQSMLDRLHALEVRSRCARSGGRGPWSSDRSRPVSQLPREPRESAPRPERRAIPCPARPRRTRA